VTRRHTHSNIVVPTTRLDEALLIEPPGHAIRIVLELYAYEGEFDLSPDDARQLADRLIFAANLADDDDAYLAAPGSDDALTVWFGEAGEEVPA
jgi:hypothetical protein